MSKGAVRRRGMSSDSTIPVEYPDAYAVTFDADAGTKVNITYGRSIIRYILDGVEYTSAGTDSVTPTTSGRHVLYFWIKSRDRLTNNVIARYLRVPEDYPYWHGSFYYIGSYLNEIAFMGKVPPTFAKEFGNWFLRTITIKVPIGCTEVYREALQNTCS